MGLHLIASSEFPAGHERVVVGNDKVVLLFVYEARDRLLIPQCMTAAEYDLFLSSKEAMYDQLCKSVTRILGKRMGRPGKVEPHLDIRDPSQVRQVVSTSFSEIKQYAPELLRGEGLDDGATAEPLPKVRVLFLPPP